MWLRVISRMCLCWTLLGAPGLRAQEPEPSSIVQRIAKPASGLVYLDDLPPVPEPADPPATYLDNGELIELPPLDDELLTHGGAQMYEPSDILNEVAPRCEDGHYEQPLRLNECWEEPQPFITWPDEYLGTGVVQWNPDLSWFGCDSYTWDPRFVLHGAYEIFGAVFEQNQERRDGIGHQLFVDLDFQLTGTERFHVQFRPVGEENTGGSFWQLNDPSRYIDNSTGVPQRWWFEGELQSMFGPWSGDERHQLDINYTIGRFPFLLHNGLLMNDEVVGVVVGKNTITNIGFSNVNIQGFYFLDELNSLPAAGDMFGTQVTADYRHVFFEATYANIHRHNDRQFTSQYLALSGTKFFGPLTIAARTMYRIGDRAAGGDGHLQVIESTLTRSTSHTIECLTGIELAVAYLNVFYASDNWVTIAGGNLNRLRNSFAVNPLVNLSAGGAPVERYGAAVGVQLFRHHQDEAIIPEFAYEEQSADTSLGIGLRYRRKLNTRMFMELRGIKNWSDAAALRREGLFAGTTIIF